MTNRLVVEHLATKAFNDKDVMTKLNLVVDIFYD
jgi:hypothetical protein